MTTATTILIEKGEKAADREEAGGRNDMKTLSLRTISFQTECTFILPPRSTVCKVVPETFMACYIVIGQVEVKMTLTLPFTSPKQLRTKIKIVFEGALDIKPYLQLQTHNVWIVKKCYAVLMIHSNNNSSNNNSCNNSHTIHSNSNNNSHSSSHTVQEPFSPRKSEQHEELLTMKSTTQSITHLHKKTNKSKKKHSLCIVI